MRSLTRDDVLHVAKLAKLDLTNEEVARFQRQLSKIVDYISQLSEIDTSSLEPTSQTTGLENVFRKDEVTESLAIDKVLKNASKHKESMFYVPKSV